MPKLLAFVLSLCLPLFAMPTYAQVDKAQLAVWANEAIVATYSLNSKNYLQMQKKIAKYFTTEAWIAYTKALNQSKLPESIQKNAYAVSAVATAPPVIKDLDANHWEATMPILVVYQNPQYKQQQQLKVVLQFGHAASGQGVRGFSITAFKTVTTEPPCVCNGGN
jgi:hypothetical protein